MQPGRVILARSVQCVSFTVCSYVRCPTVTKPHMVRVSARFARHASCWEARAVWRLLCYQCIVIPRYPAIVGRL